MPGIPPASPVEPWHMWGTSQVVRIDNTLGASSRFATQLLSRINYRRPETWSFWLGARLVGGDTNTAAVNLVLSVGFDLIVGVGLSLFRTELTNAPTIGGNFCLFTFLIAPGATPGVAPNSFKWSASVRSPPQNDGDATSYNLIDHVVAQDLQCYGRAAFVAPPSPPLIHVDVELTALFAPRVHVRPDWFTDEGESDEANEANKYLGNERRGT